MARKPNQQTTRPASPSLPGKDLDLAQRAFVAGNDEATSREGGIRQLHELIGRMQMAAATEDLFRTVRTSDLAKIKELKLYQSLKGAAHSGRPEKLSGTWEEFCTLIARRSVDQVDEDIKNFRSFGEQALESMSSAGIGYRELRQLRQLPEDGKVALEATIAKGNKDDIRGVVEDLLARKDREIRELAKERDKATADYEARERVVEQNKNQIQRLKEQVARIPRERPDEKSKAMLVEIATIASEVARGARDALGGIEQLLEHVEEHELDEDAHKREIARHVAGLVEDVSKLTFFLKQAQIKQ